MNGISYRVWAPPESRVRIEYSTELVRQLSRESAGRETSGILLGTRHGNTIRIADVATVANPIHEIADGREPVGIFSVRPRGDIFLAESDLKRFEQSSAQPSRSGGPSGETADHVALVVAGGKGGGFVRDADGSIQAVRSYREFPLVGGAAAVSRATKVQLRWSWVLLSGLAVVALPFVLTSQLGAMFKAHPITRASPAPRLPEILAVHYARRRVEAPLDLTVKRDAATLRITWNRLAISDTARLEITEAARRAAILLPPDLTSVTYTPDSGDVEIQLTVIDGGSLEPRLERVHFVGSSEVYATERSPGVDLAYAQVANLELEASSVRAAIENRRASVAALQEKVRRLIQPGGE